MLMDEREGVGAEGSLSLLDHFYVDLSDDHFSSPFQFLFSVFSDQFGFEYEQVNDLHTT